MAADIDTLLQGEKQFLPHRIEFHKARRPDTRDDGLRAAFTPVNSAPSLQGKAGGKSPAPPAKAAPNGDDGQELYPASQIPGLMQWREIIKVGAGFENLGNTCFLNSVLQCLTYCPPLVNYLESQDHQCTCRKKDFCALCEMSKHVARALERGGSSIAPRNITSNLRGIAKHMRLGRQEDSHEFCRYLIEAMQDSALARIKARIGNKVPAAISDTSAIFQIFGGYLRSQVKCTSCRYESNTDDPFLDLSLEIRTANSLDKALKDFTRTETLDADNMWKCSKCSKYVQAKKCMKIHRPPNVLTVQFKRFSFGHRFGGKIGKHIEFGERLDLGEHMINYNGPRPLYNLFGVLVHDGYSTNSGHYYAFIKAPAGVWFCMNDSSVKQVKQDTVMKQNAYMLFYLRDTHTRTPMPPRSPSTPMMSPRPMSASANGGGAGAAPQSPTSKTLQAINKAIPQIVIRHDAVKLAKENGDAPQSPIPEKLSNFIGKASPSRRTLTYGPFMWVEDDTSTAASATTTTTTTTSTATSTATPMDTTSTSSGAGAGVVTGLSVLSPSNKSKVVIKGKVRADVLSPKVTAIAVPNGHKPITASPAPPAAGTNGLGVRPGRRRKDDSDDESAMSEASDLPDVAPKARPATSHAPVPMVIDERGGDRAAAARNAAKLQEQEFPVVNKTKGKNMSATNQLKEIKNRREWMSQQKKATSHTHLGVSGEETWEGVEKERDIQKTVLKTELRPPKRRRDQEDFEMDLGRVKKIRKKNPTDGTGSRTNVFETTFQERNREKQQQKQQALRRAK